MGNPELYPEHLLLALLDQELPQELVPDAAALRAQAEATLRTKPSTQGAQQQPAVSAAVSRVLDAAFDEARRMEDEYVSTEHLLAGLARGGGAVAGAGVGRAAGGAVAGARGGPCANRGEEGAMRIFEKT